MDDEFEILSMRSINQDGFVVFDNFSKENKESLLIFFSNRVFIH